jgi:type II secretory pathway predicted ATPase ExeA
MASPWPLSWRAVQTRPQVLVFYQLSEQPFGVTPDPRYLFLSPTHREALASAVYGVSAGRGFTALIAKPGMGKTTLLFKLLNKVRDQAKTAFLFQSQCSPQDLLRSLLEDLGIENDSGDLMRMQRKLNECLLSEASKGKQLVVVIDEAQNLDEPVLEVLRMLSNFETPREKLMHFILAGQPKLAEKLDSPGLLQLRQRISIIARLKPFTVKETQLYIDHRLRVAGYDFKRPLFTKQAVAMIAEYAEGTPRNINNLCFNAMSIGCVYKQKSIDAEVIREVLGDLDLRSMFPELTRVSKSEEPNELVPALLSRETSRSRLRRWSIRLALASALVIVAVNGLLVRTKQHTANVLAWATSPTVTVKDFVATPVSSPVAPSPEPMAVPEPVASTSQSTGATFIVVQPNDTLYRICLENFGRYDEETLARMRKLNPWLTNPRRIRVGRKIWVPGTRSESRRISPSAEQIPSAVGEGTEKP